MLQEIDEELLAVGVWFDVVLLEEVLLGVEVQVDQVEQLDEVLVNVLLECLLQLPIDETVELGLQPTYGVIQVVPLLDERELSDEVVVPIVIDHDYVFQQLVFFLYALELVDYHYVETLQVLLEHVLHHLLLFPLLTYHSLQLDQLLLEDLVYKVVLLDDTHFYLRWAVFQTSLLDHHDFEVDLDETLNANMLQPLPVEL